MLFQKDTKLKNTKHCSHKVHAVANVADNKYVSPSSTALFVSKTPKVHLSEVGIVHVTDGK